MIWNSNKRAVWTVWAVDLWIMWMILWMNFILCEFTTNNSGGLRNSSERLHVSFEIRRQVLRAILELGRVTAEHHVRRSCKTACGWKLIEQQFIQAALILRLPAAKHPSSWEKHCRYFSVRSKSFSFLSSQKGPAFFDEDDVCAGSWTWLQPVRFDNKIICEK